MKATATAGNETGLAGFIRAWTRIHAALLVVAYVTLVLVSGVTLSALLEAWNYFPIGIFGAVVANSTGTGGGVVFVPAFATDQIGPPQSVGMSFLIQSFGMSVGSLVWLNTFFVSGKVKPTEKMEPNTLFGIICLVVVTCLPSLLLTQWLFYESVPQNDVLTWFKLFSIALGAALLVVTLVKDPFAPKNFRLTVTTRDNAGLAVIGVIGGVVTAFFSVGVGEFLAIYLIIRNYPTLSAIVCAVIVSVLTVLTGVIYHLVKGTIGLAMVPGSDTLVASPRWDVVLVAIPGALVGGYLARVFASFLGADRLKLFASLWIVFSALYLLWQGTVMSGSM